MPHLTITGNVVNDPTLRTTKDGMSVANFRVATTPRYQDKRGQWTDGDTLFLSVTCWRRLGENVAASLRRGDPVLLSGRLMVRGYETAGGETRTSVEIEATAVGPDLTRSTATVTRIRRADAPLGSGPRLVSAGGDADEPATAEGSRDGEPAGERPVEQRPTEGASLGERPLDDDGRLAPVS